MSKEFKDAMHALRMSGTVMTTAGEDVLRELLARSAPESAQEGAKCRCSLCDEACSCDCHNEMLAAPQRPVEGEKVMVNTPYDVFILPLQPSGLSSGPRFVVHVPGPEQPAAGRRWRLPRAPVRRALQQADMRCRGGRR